MADSNRQQTLSSDFDFQTSGRQQPAVIQNDSAGSSFPHLSLNRSPCMVAAPIDGHCLISSW